jgi:hypothetical protein
LGWEDGWHLVQMPASEAKERLTLVHQDASCLLLSIFAVRHRSPLHSMW